MGVVIGVQVWEGDGVDPLTVGSSGLWNVRFQTIEGDDCQIIVQADTEWDTNEDCQFTLKKMRQVVWPTSKEIRGYHEMVVEWMRRAHASRVRDYKRNIVVGRETEAFYYSFAGCFPISYDGHRLKIGYDTCQAVRP